MGISQTATHLCQRSTCLWVDWIMINTFLMTYFQGVSDCLTIGMYSSPVGLIMPGCRNRSREVDFRDPTRAFDQTVPTYNVVQRLCSPLWAGGWLLSPYSFFMGLEIENAKHKPRLEMPVNTLHPWLAWNWSLVILPRPTTRDHPIRSTATVFRLRHQKPVGGTSSREAAWDAQSFVSILRVFQVK